MVKNLLRQKLENKFLDVDFDVLVPPNPKMGDYSANIAFALGKKEGKDPMKSGEGLASELNKDKDLAGIFEKIEAVKPGFVNFYLKDDFIRTKLSEMAEDKNYGFNETMKGKTVMVEYTDPNPFKLFHIGHLMSNTIGEAIARLYEASGAKVLRANYQGDVGLHVALTIWAIKSGKVGAMPPENELLDEKIKYLGNAYALGSSYYYKTLAEGGPDFRQEIHEINNKIYKKDDPQITELYEKGKRWSLDYFETIYKKLGTKFNRYFFESEAATDGLRIVGQHPDVFVESDGAKVFKGEEYGLHTRVFVSSKGLPTYESKELGVNKKKFEKDNLDLSIIVTGNEINDYFKVLLKVMELTMPEVVARTRHISHGMLRLPGGKMSSRTGDVITADSLIEQTKEKLPESESGEAKEKIAIGAIKYSILKQSPGHDIIFDFDKSLSVKGDSAPYLQYTYARFNNIVTKSESNPSIGSVDPAYLNEPVEVSLMKYLFRFPEIVKESGEEIAPQHLALYLYELSNEINRFYESVRVLEDENAERRNARLILVETVATVLKRGLNLLGIETPKRI